MKKKAIVKIIPLIIALVIALSTVTTAAYWATQTEGKAISKLTNNVALALNYNLTPYVAYFFPRYPQRLNYITLEIAESSRQLTEMSQELGELLDQCDCRHAQSSCRRKNNICQPKGPCPLGIYGDPCPSRKEIEEMKSKIEEKIRHISSLRDLLIKEMDSGLEKELETLNEEVAQELVNNLEKVLSESQAITAAAEQNLILSQCTRALCAPSCKMGDIFKVEACLAIGTGEQNPISIEFEVKVGVEDMDLGEATIQDVNLGLPEKINISKLGKLSGFTITGKETTFNIVDAGNKKVYLQTPKAPSLPEPPSLNFSCPQYSGSSSYSCDLPPKEDEESIEQEWFYQRYSYLSGKCQELPGMFDQLGLTANAEGCFNYKQLPQTIVSTCNQLWQEFCQCNLNDSISDCPRPEPPGFCQSIRKFYPEKTNIAAADRCKELYTQEGLSVPSECHYTIFEYEEDPYYPCRPHIYNTSANFDPVGAIDSLCEEIKAQKRKEAPEICKMLPVFSEFIREPGGEEFTFGGGTCTGQTLRDFPTSPLGCPSSPSTIPKINLPKIIIPDIVLPTFNISPFLSIKLPSFIFEDLIFDDIELCNLDDCHGFFPKLNFQTPVLTLPEIELDPIDLGVVSGVELPSIDLPPIKLPTIPLSLLQLPELENLIIPEITLSGIEMPKIRVSLTFSGIDLSGIFGYIASFVANALGIPDQSLCIGYDFSTAPLQIIFPDYYFYWPEFLKIPQIDFCKETNSFCRETKNYFGQITDQVDKIEKTFNEFAQAEIQAKLDSNADIIKEEIESRIREQLEAQKERILAEVQKQIDSGEKEITIMTEDINIPEISLDEFIDLPDAIKIPWSDGLKQISLDIPLSYNLPKIPLSNLSYEKNIIIKGPGFNSRTFSFGLSTGNLGACFSQSPTGGNPCYQDDYQDNINNINRIYQNINEFSQEIRKILD